MMERDPEDIGKIVLKAREALKRGDTINVTRLARLAASLEPDSEVAWLLLAAVARPDDSLAFVRKALEIDPDSEPAQKALRWAQGRLPKQPAEEPHTIVAQTQTPQEEPAQPANETRDLNEAPEPVSVEFPESLEEVYSQLDEPAPALDEQLEPPAKSPGIFDEEPALDVEAWTYKTQPVPVARTMHPVIRPQNLTDSPSQVTGTGKKARFSPVLLLGSILGVLAIAALAGWIFLRPQLARLWAGISPPDPCQASLMIGSHTFQVRTLQPKKDGSYAVPDDQPGWAYWVADTDSNPVFMINPDAETLALVAGLQPGGPALFTRTDCNLTTYSLALAMPVELDMPALLDQTRTGLTLILPWQGSASGFVLLGEQHNFLLPLISTPVAGNGTIPLTGAAEETPLPINTPDYSEFLAEISLLETTASADGSSLRVDISIYNYGQIVNTLFNNDVSLTPEGGAPMVPVLVEPALPFEMRPGTTRTLSFTFLRPAAASATLRILSVEFDLEDY